LGPQTSNRQQQEPPSNVQGGIYRMSGVCGPNPDSFTGKCPEAMGFALLKWGDFPTAS